MKNLNVTAKRYLLVTAAVTLMAVLFLFSQALQVGYVVIAVDPGSPMPIATALFSSWNTEGVLVAEAGVAAVRPISAGRIFVDENGPSTGIAWANPVAATITLALTMRDESGDVVSEKTITLAPRKHLAKFVTENDLFPNLPDGFVGSLTFRVNQAARKVGAVTLRQSVNAQGEALLATLPVVDLDQSDQSDAIVFPHLGAGGIITTQIILISGSDQSISGTIRLFSSAGLPLALQLDGVSGSQFPYELEPNGVFRGNLTLASNTAQAGYAVVTVDEGVAPAGTAIFQFRDGDKVMSEAGVGAIPATTKARIFVDNVGTQTGVAIASPDNNAIEVTFDLLDNNGFVMERSVQQIPADGHLSIFADQLFDDLPANFNGVMEISSPAAIVPITLKLTQNSRSDLILTTLPIADLTQPINASSLIFPQIGVGDFPGVGSFATRLITIQTDTATAATGTFSFFQSNGTAMVLPMSGETGSVFDFELPKGGERQFYPGVTSELGSVSLLETDVAVNDGGEFPLRLITLDEDGRSRDDFKATFQSLSPDKVTVDALGILSGQSRGFGTVTVSLGGFVSNVNVTVATVTGGAQGFEVTGIAQDSGKRVFLTSSKDHTIMMAEDITETPKIWAGKSNQAGLVNEFRLQSQFSVPSFVTLDQSQGHLYVSDSANHVIRLIRQEDSEKVRTLAGAGGISGKRDGTLLSARFKNPEGIALGRGGRVWVVDSGNHTIRRIDVAANTVETVAGLAGSSGNTDGQGTAARFNSPQGIAVETEGLAEQLERELLGNPPPPVSMIVADSGNNVLRRVWEDGTVETISPDNLNPASRKKSGPVKARLAAEPFRFNAPTGVVVDSFGDIYFTEPGKNRVRVLLKTGKIWQAAQPGSFQAPKGLAVSTKGRVVVAESLRSAQEIRYAGPSFTRIEPQVVNVEGGEEVVIFGSNLATDTLVIVGGVPILDSQVLGNSRVRFTAPPLPSGKLTVTLRHRGGLAQGTLLVTPSPVEQIGPGEITTIVGGVSSSGDGRAAANASLDEIAAVAFDSAGNMFIADRSSNRIRKVDAVTRLITTVAGTGDSGYSGDGGPAVAARLASPEDIVFDQAGNLYIADTLNNVVRKVSAEDNTISTFAGGGSQGWGEDGIPARQASFMYPFGVAVSKTGDVYISDTGHHLVRKVSAQDGTISTVAGQSEPGYSGDGELAIYAYLNLPTDLAFNSKGQLFIADTGNNMVRRIDLVGNITRAAGSPGGGFSGDGGIATQASLYTPLGVAVDSNENLLIADFGNHRVRVVKLSTRIIETKAGNGQGGFSGDGGPAAEASLDFPGAVAFDASGNVFIGDSGNRRVRLVNRSTEIIQTVAGNGLLPDVGDGGVAYAASLSAPHGLAVDDAGHLFIADTGHHLIREVLGRTPSSKIGTAAGTGERGQSEDGTPALEAALDTPTDVLLDPSGLLLVVEKGNHKIRRLEPPHQQMPYSFFRMAHTGSDDVVVTIVGNGTPGASGDGKPAWDAQLSSPHSAAVDSVGNIFIADTGNHRIRMIDEYSGNIFTVAGTGEPGSSGSGIPATQASLRSPSAVVVDSSGIFYIADTGNNRVLRVNDGFLEIFAGTGKRGYAGDGGPATGALLNHPNDLVLNSGKLYIADRNNHCVRSVSLKTGIIRTVAGRGVAGFSGDGGPATKARMNTVESVVFDSNGNLFISDALNGRIRAVRGPLN